MAKDELKKTKWNSLGNRLVRNVHGKSFGSNIVGKKIKDGVQKTRELVNTFKSKFRIGNTPIMSRIANSNFGKRAFKVLGEAVKVGAVFVSIGFGIWDILRGTKKLTSGNIGDTILLEANQNSMRLQDILLVYEKATGKFTENQ